MTSNDNRGGTVSFMARFTQSEQFNEVFAEGMGLVEETANYLDGPGRTDSRALDRQGSIAYATESMRLTTRLMQLASWLLLQRAISTGELDEAAAREEKRRINLNEIGSPDAAVDETMPEGLRNLIGRSLRVHQRVMKLDKMIGDKVEPKAVSTNPVSDQLDKLNRAFSRH